MRAKAMTGMIMGALLLMAAPVFAEEAAPKAPQVVTSTGRELSIQLPDENWKVTEDANHLLVLTDGDDLITVDHLDAGVTPPAAALADDTYAAVYQAFVSTRNETFAVKGAVVKQEDLTNVMQSIGTLQILNPDAVKAASAAANETKNAATDLRSIGADYYVTGDDVNVRKGCSVDDEVVGSVNRGDRLYVDGAVLANGEENGWYQVKYNDQTAFVSARFLTQNAPAAGSTASQTAPAAAQSAGSTDLVYCEYCGQWYPAGNEFRNHICPARDAAYAQEAAAIDSGSTADNLVYCEYCGQWYQAGNEFRNHICPARDAAYAQEAYDIDSDSDSSEDDLVYCEYCGQWYQAGNEFRNHICPARDAAYEEE